LYGLSRVLDSFDWNGLSLGLRFVNGPDGRSIVVWSHGDQVTRLEARLDGGGLEELAVCGVSVMVWEGVSISS
jgi:hypothetical protein